MGRKIFWPARKRHSPYPKQVHSTNQPSGLGGVGGSSLPPPKNDQIQLQLGDIRSDRTRECQKSPELRIPACEGFRQVDLKKKFSLVYVQDTKIKFSAQQVLKSWWSMRAMPSQETRHSPDRPAIASLRLPRNTSFISFEIYAPSWLPNTRRSRSRSARASPRIGQKPPAGRSDTGTRPRRDIRRCVRDPVTHVVGG